jgi:AcrR family transcriptional regulator
MSDDRTEVPMVDSVQQGVFFTTPSDLPKGRHTLAREAVRAAQTERLLISVTELMAAEGYRTIGVREIAARARVSRAAFYECFPDKDACVFAAYDRFIEVLLTQVAVPLTDPTDWDSTVSGVLTAYVDTLASDPVVARAFQVEMDALGRRARDVRREALTSMAALLKQRRDEIWPEQSDIPLDAYTGAIYAIRQLASDALDADDDAHLLDDLAARAEPWIARLLSDPTALVESL